VTQRSEEPVGAPARRPIRGIEVAGRAAVLRDRLPVGVRHGLRDGARAYGALTSQLRAPTDFLIIGAKKAGTSSLMNWLLGHLAVAELLPGPQGIKSPHYFDINYWRGPRWYLSHFPTRASRRRQERACGSLSVAGEASPYYLFHPAAAERATTDLPAVRVIALLREPVGRAYSNIWDRKAFGARSSIASRTPRKPRPTGWPPSTRIGSGTTRGTTRSITTTSATGPAAGTPSSFGHGSTGCRRTGCSCRRPRTCSAIRQERSRLCSASSGSP